MHEGCIYLVIINVHVEHMIDGRVIIPEYCNISNKITSV